jgi:hypothetical protein
MSKDDESEIIYHNRIKQVLDYAGMKRHRNIRPSDIDGVYDYNGVAFLYIEAKKEGRDIDNGQRMLYENICKSHQKAGHEAATIMFTHNTSPSEVINTATQSVIKIYYNGRWVDMSNKKKTVIDVVEGFEESCIKKGLKI